MSKLDQIPSPGKDKQMNIPELDIKPTKKFEQLKLPPFKELEEKDLNLEKYLLFPEGSRTGQYNETEKDNKIELINGEWFINDNKKPVTFLEADEIMKRGPGLKFALRNKKFKRIYDHFQRIEGVN